MKKYLCILLIGLLLAGCTTTFRPSEYKNDVNVKIERNAHFVNTIEADGFIALAATSKFSVAPNDSMTAAIDESVRSILAEKQPFTGMRAEREESAEIIADDIYIILILNKLKAYINTARNRSAYDLTGTFIIADGRGNVYSSKPYSVSEESSVGTLQAAQNKAVTALMDAFFSVLARIDLEKPVEGDNPEDIIKIIQANL